MTNDFLFINFYYVDGKCNSKIQNKMIFMEYIK